MDSVNKNKEIKTCNYCGKPIGYKGVSYENINFPTKWFCSEHFHLS